MLEAIEKELKHQVAGLDQPRSRQFHEMLTYHMGWTGEGAGSHAAGKRIRPLLTLLVVVASNRSGGGDGIYWLRAVSSAAAIELIHIFTVHDDIQDNSVMRRTINSSANGARQWRSMLAMRCL